ncbi:unnamed protein product [Blepharisma stoltei]|uniref:Uncharacterized protein n=1 Tax=Blepharisma stoltei TaxID=1481888 RepID=A0AAU9IAB5_9CILI|nr:unnamed protein product [Blepharisma stoltei]
MAAFDEPLCGCLSEMCSCLIACFVPCGTCCLQAWSVNKAYQEGLLKPFILPCLLFCFGAAINRGQIRKKYHIEGSFITDCLIEWICAPCAVTQEYREVNRREGFN